MTTDEVRRRVEAQSQSLSLALYEGVATGIAEATAMLGALPRRHEYPHLLPLSARAFMRNYWLDEGLAEGWNVGGNPRLMGQTILSNDAENIEMRLLKERRRTYPGGVPVAGSNEARRGYWEQLPFGMLLPTQPLLEDRVRLLALWDQREDGTLTLRVVHTLHPGTYGQRVPLDLSYEIKPGGGIFDTLHFGPTGAPGDDELWADIDREENEGDGLAQ